MQGCSSLRTLTRTHEHLNLPWGKRVDTDYDLFPSLNLTPERDYSGDPKTGHVRYSNGWNLFGHEMVRFLNGFGQNGSQNGTSLECFSYE